MSDKRPTNLFAKVQSVLAGSEPLKAKEISKQLGVRFKQVVDKSQVNAILYQHQNVHFKVHDEYRWASLGLNGSTEKPVANAASTSQIEGILIAIGDAKTGCHNGRWWRKQDIILKAVPDNEDLLLTIWNDKIDLANIKPGDILKATFEVKAKQKSGGNWKSFRELKTLEVQKHRFAEDDLPF